MSVMGGGGRRTAVPAAVMGTGRMRRVNVGEFFIGEFFNSFY